MYFCVPFPLRRATDGRDVSVPADYFIGNYQIRTSFQCSLSSSKDEESIYYINSLGANLKDLKDNVKIHLSQIYRTTSAVLQVTILRVQQQPNSYDCGLFAIANAVEFCFAPDSFNTRVTYNVSKMREHLIENGNVTISQRKSKSQMYT